MRIRLAMQGCAWPGCYPTYLVMSDGGGLCSDCVKKELRLIISAFLSGDTSGGWYPIGADVNYECDCLFCDNCNAKIEAAYIEDK